VEKTGEQLIDVVSNLPTTWRNFTKSFCGARMFPPAERRWAEFFLTNDSLYGVEGPHGIWPELSMAGLSAGIEVTANFQTA